MTPAAPGLAKDKTTTPAPERVYHVFEVTTRAASIGAVGDVDVATPATTVFTLLDKKTASNDLAAIKATVGEREGSFVAIAERSINVRTRRVETVKQDHWT